MNPLVSPSLAHAKESRDDFLQGIDFEVKQNEEQLIFNRQQMGLATAPKTSLARLFVPEMMGDLSFPDLFKRDQQRLNFFGVKGGQGTQNTRFVFEGIIGEHRAPSGMIGLKLGVSHLLHMAFRLVQCGS